MNVPGYTVVREIGRGGMSSVYLAVQESLDRQVALKILSPSLARDPQFKGRFLKEGRTVAKLSHPYIVTVYDIGFADDQAFISMEYIEGRDLGEHIARGLAVEESCRIVKRIARALGYAHARGFVHRDLKPSNVLFREDKYAVLADFGIAKSLNDDRTQTQTGFILGTPNYMSPEQAQGRPLDGRSDLYSLGAVFYEMLTGRRLFDGDTAISVLMMHLREPPPELPERFAGFRPLMARLLAKEPAERFGSADEFIGALEALESTHHAVHVDVPARDQETIARRPPMQRPRARSRAIGLGVAAAGAVAVILAFVLTSEPGRMDDVQSPETSQPVAEVPVEPAAVSAASGTSASPPPVDPAAQLREDAARAYAAGDFDQTLALLDEALKTAPGDAALTELKSDAQVALERNRESERIRSLLQKASAQLAADRLTQPDGANALDSYEDVLSIDPQNSEARLGIREIATRYGALAVDRQRSGDIEGGLEMVERGLSVEEQNPLLLGLRGELRKQADEQSKRRDMEQLNSRLEEQLEARKLSAPPGDNALATIRAVAERDPGNPWIEQAKRKLVMEYETSARSKRTNGELAESLALVEEGLGVEPNDATLLAMQRDLREEIDAQREAEAEPRAEEPATRRVFGRF